VHMGGKKTIIVAPQQNCVAVFFRIQKCTTKIKHYGNGDKLLTQA